MHAAIQLYDSHFTFTAYKDRDLPFMVSFSRTVLGDLVFLFSQLTGTEHKLNISSLEEYIASVFDGISYCYIYLKRYTAEQSAPRILDDEGRACLSKYAALLEQIADTAVAYMEENEARPKAQVQGEAIQHELRSNIIQ